MHRLIAFSCLCTINHFYGGNHWQAQSGSGRCPDGERPQLLHPSSSRLSCQNRTTVREANQNRNMLHPVPCSTAFSPPPSQQVWTEGLSHCAPLSSQPLFLAQLSSLCGAGQPPASSMLQTVADTPGPLQATQARNLNLVDHHTMPCEESTESAWATFSCGPFSCLLPLAPVVMCVSVFYHSIWPHSPDTLTTTHCPRS